MIIPSKFFSLKVPKQRFENDILYTCRHYSRLNPPLSVKALCPASEQIGSRLWIETQQPFTGAQQWHRIIWQRSVEETLHPTEMTGTFTGRKNAIIQAGSRPGCHTHCKLGISENEMADVFLNFCEAKVLLIKSVRTTLLFCLRLFFLFSFFF